MPEILPSTEYPSKYTQECYNCREAIHAGSYVVAGAINLKTEDPVWMHPACARFYKFTFGIRKVIEQGWRIATLEQRCKGGCDLFITPGEKIYRRWKWDEGATFHFDVECHACHRSHNGATVLEVTA